jgi:hypothetical protein
MQNYPPVIFHGESKTFEPKGEFSLKIDVPKEDALQRIRFWAVRAQRNLKLIEMFLNCTEKNNPKYQSSAKKLAKKWTNYVDSLKNDEIHSQDLQDLTLETAKYYNTLLDARKSGEWIGNIDKDTVLNALIELELLVDTLSEDPNPFDLLQYWNRYGRGATFANIQHLDRTMLPEIRRQFELSGAFDALANYDEWARRNCFDPNGLPCMAEYAKETARIYKIYRKTIEDLQGTSQIHSEITAMLPEKWLDHQTMSSESAVSAAETALDRFQQPFDYRPELIREFIESDIFQPGEIYR